jgi:type VI secretion system protein ImpA
VLVRELNEKMGRYAPGLSAIREALANCRSLAQQVLQKKGPAPSEPASGEGGEAEGGEPEGGEAEGGVATGRAKRIVTRADVYQRLAEAAALLQQMEPHSPVPYLIQRAIELGAMQFPDLMKNLVLNPDVLKTMNRELGIKEEVKK